MFGNRTNFRDTRPELTSLPQLFRQQGYVTARTGKIFHDIYDDEAGWTVGGGSKLLMPPIGMEHKKVIARLPDAPVPVGVAAPLPADNQQAAHSDQILVLAGNGEGRPENLVAETAMEYLRTYRNQSFIIGCGFFKPHSPPTAQQRFLICTTQRRWS